MKLRVPDYYYDFKCIGGDCTDSCCIGWELDIKKLKEALGIGLGSLWLTAQTKRMSVIPLD